MGRVRSVEWSSTTMISKETPDCVVRDWRQSSRPPRMGSSAPDFTVQDSQNKVTLSQFHGQVVVLNFWATWCAPCVEEIPSLVAMQRRMKEKGVTVVAVSVDVDESAYRQFVRD